MREVTSLDSVNKKRLKSKDKKYIKEPIIAAFITALFVFALAVIGQIYPFGENTILVSDLEAQYAPFLFMYKSWIKSIDSNHFLNSISYINNMGTGKNSAGTYAYYLGSPVNLLVFLFKNTQVSEFITVIMGVKLMLASAFMCIFLNLRNPNKDSKLPIMFGIMYAFTSYSMFFTFNIMWLDGYMLLPLLLYFVENEIRGKRKYIQIVITLLILFVSNYYIAYMVGLMSFFYMLVRLFMENPTWEQYKKKIGVIVRYILTAVFCGLSVCVVLLPAALDTLGNAVPDNGNPEVLFNHNIIELARCFFTGANGDFGDIMIDNNPFLFCSLFVTVLTVLYLVSGAFKGRIKNIHIACLIAVLASVEFKVIDLAWQAFDEPNWFSHREVFVFYPVFFVIAQNTLLKIREITYKEFFKAWLILSGTLIVISTFAKDILTDRHLFMNMLLISVFIILLALCQKQKWHEQLRNMPKILPGLLAIIAVFEAAIFTSFLGSNLSTFLVTYGDGVEYKSVLETVEDFSKISDISNQGYRMDIESRAPDMIFEGPEQNNAYYIGYNGLSYFNSNSNKAFHKFLKQFGYNVNYNYFAVDYCYSAPSSDAFWSVGEMITRTDYSLAEKIAEDTNDFGMRLYRNNNVLPLGFAVADNASDFDFYMLESDEESKDYFDFQNDLYAALFPNSFGTDFWIPAYSDAEAVYINGVNIDMSGYRYGSEEANTSISLKYESENSSSSAEDVLFSEANQEPDNKITVYASNTEVPIIIRYDLVATDTSELYMNVSAANHLNKGKVYVNGQEVAQWADGSFYSRIIRLGSFEIGEEIQVDIMSKNPEFGYQAINFAYFDKASFDAQFETLDTGNVQLTEVSNGYFAFECDMAEGEMLLTTIPYEKGWTVQVDGEDAEIVPVGDALIAVNVGSGHHVVTMTFVAPGLKIGGICTIIGLVSLISMAIVDKKKQTT